MTIAELIDHAHNTARAKGWWDGATTGGPNIPEKLALIHSEISEALEEYRHGHMEARDESGKPEGFPVEIADAVIRIADLCGYLQIDLEACLRAKMAYNETRSYRHGGKKA